MVKALASHLTCKAPVRAATLPALAFLLVLGVCLSRPSRAEPASENDLAAGTAPNQKPESIAELPMYGGAAFSEQQARANNEFIAEVEKEVGRLEGAKRAVKRGWEALKARDFRTAMRRFNQAWLLDPNNPRVYEGLATTVIVWRERVDTGEFVLREGLKRTPRDAGLLADLATVQMGQMKFAEAIETADKALAIDSQGQQQLHRTLMLAFQGLGQTDSMLRHARIACSRGEVIEAEILAELARTDGRKACP